jgi:ubiquinone/menaquinone biosynthesis C-methylase UbiE
MFARGTKRNAALYSQVSDFHLQCGKSLALTAGIKHGDKVLDMGCGTGELTAILAQMEWQANIILKKIIFLRGDSSSRFPHFNNRYYDVHFSSFAFQWLNSDEKEEFINTAFQVLKPGGKIAIQSHEGDNASVMKLARKFHDKTKSTMAQLYPHYVSKAMTESLLRKAGCSILYSDYYYNPHTFGNAEDFLAFFYASEYYEETNISQKKKTDLIRRIVNEDGSVTVFDPTVYQIVARKVESE